MVINNVQSENDIAMQFAMCTITQAILEKWASLRVN